MFGPSSGLKRWLLICLFIVAAAISKSAGAQANVSSSGAADLSTYVPVIFENTTIRLDKNSNESPFILLPIAGRSAAPPTPSANPGGEPATYPFEIGVAFKLVRFRSAPFSATLFGLQTSLVYFPKRSAIGFETNCTHAWGTHVFADEQSRFWLYGGGPRWARRGHRWEPFVHAIFGGVRAWPQTALGEPNALGLQFGGGTNVPLRPHLSLQMSGDYVRTFLYGSGQNNLQAGFGIVIPF